MWGSTFAEIARKAQELQDQAASTVVRCSCGGGGRSNAFVVWSGETSDSIIIVVVDGWMAGWHYYVFGTKGSCSRSFLLSHPRMNEYSHHKPPACSISMPCKTCRRRHRRHPLLRLTLIMEPLRRPLFPLFRQRPLPRRRSTRNNKRVVNALTTNMLLRRRHKRRRRSMIRKVLPTSFRRPTMIMRRSGSDQNNHTSRCQTR
jgi:hypothetical protein